MKKLAVVLAALMMLSTTTFLAAPSVDTAVKSETTGVTATAPVESQVADAVVEAEEKFGEEAEVLAVTVLTGTVPADGKVTLGEIAGVTANDKIEALHFYNNEWVKRPASVVDGKVVVDFTGAEHFSPVVIVKVPAAEVPYDGLHFATGATKLPKTGAVAVLPVAAMACLAGAVVCGRKEK